MGSLAVASRDEGQTPTSQLSNAAIFARLNELDKWRLEVEQAWASELEKQKQEDAMILEQRSRFKEEFDQWEADHRQQTRREMETLLDALQANIARDLSEQSLSNSTITDKGRATEAITPYEGTLELARPVGSSFRPVNETPPAYRLSSGQPQKRRLDDTTSTPPARQKRKYTRRTTVSGGQNPATQGSSLDEYNHRIWTHPVTGMEYFVECPKCQKRKFKSLMGLKRHYSVEHEKNGITVDNLALALDLYGVPVESALQSGRMPRAAEVPLSKDQDPIPDLQQGTTLTEMDGYSPDEEPAENGDEDSSISV